ncbi:sn-glycerol-3-phosphate ABC transporter ATP-binding protein UgpC [Mesorhizobium sp. YR577]|uniref:ABC transporter ATP-binding protein n=1 Tax=Mesorhizobium sp. YR577 TaxID=1884373 RepID=UPI0008F02CC0|nr:sn-glycerol-3-phosphate ABC transporter ATP-binding protein UgpC [Mesorhizobium sp. YR577]SFU20308.1 carbohydrate ABC transporter ATP-binding protein, CUT1 family [Mesorhizobium sp. YR577]
MDGIEISALHKIYGKTPAVRGVNLSIEPGEFVVILGPSGCGKSTLLRMIAGLEDITSGTISIGDTIVNQVEPGGRGCAMVFQNYALYPHMTVAENIGYAPKVAGVSKLERHARVADVAAMLGLQGLLDRRPGQLSGGQRQRVAMGRAMIRAPRVFLFDEPLSNLDAKLRIQMRLEIKRLHRELKTTSIFVTHDQMEAMTLADKLVVMNGGLIEQVGAPTDIYHRPATRFVADFLGSPPMNFIPGRIGAEGRAVANNGLLLCADAFWELAPNTEIVIGIRPAALQISDFKALGGLPFDIEMQEDLGTELHIHGVAASQRVTMVRPADSPLPTDPFAVSIPARAIHLFRVSDGKRVDPHVINLPETLNGDSRWNAKQLLSI